MGNNRQTDRLVEIYKLHHDFLKHVASIDSASILLMVTFLEKLFKQPTQRYLVGVSFVAFLLSLLGTFIIQAQILLLAENDDESPIPDWVGATTLVLVFGGVFVGLLSLGLFAMVNFFGGSP